MRPPLKFHFTARTTLPYPWTPFLMLGSCIRLIWCHFYSCFLSNWLLAEKFSNCSNSLNFEAKINCNTTEPNVPKWRKTCTGLQFDIVHFNGPQSHILFVGNLWGPCTTQTSRFQMISKSFKTFFSGTKTAKQDRINNYTLQCNGLFHI